MRGGDAVSFCREGATIKRAALVMGGDHDGPGQYRMGARISLYSTRKTVQSGRFTSP